MQWLLTIATTSSLGFLSGCVESGFLGWPGLHSSCRHSIPLGVKISTSKLPLQWAPTIKGPGGPCWQMLRLEGRGAARWENRATPFRRYQRFLSLGLAGSCMPHPSPTQQFQHSCCSFCHLNSNPIWEIDGRSCPWQHNVSSAQCPAGSAHIIIMRCPGGPRWLSPFTGILPFYTNFSSLTCTKYLFKIQTELAAWKTVLFFVFAF